MNHVAKKGAEVWVVFAKATRQRTFTFLYSDTDEAVKMVKEIIANPLSFLGVERRQFKSAGMELRIVR